jgi:hypothetical protein
MLNNMNIKLITIYLYMEKKSKHGMTSEQATEKKKNGHYIEEVFSSKIGGCVVKGTGKVDVIYFDNRYSIKRGKKVQWALLSKDSIIDKFQKNEISTNELNDYFEFLPNKDLYLNNRSLYKNNIKAEALSKVVSENLLKILNIVITNNGEINKLCFYDDRTQNGDLGSGNFFIFDASDALNVIVNMVKDVYFTPGGKVVIKGDLQLFEIELRKGTNHKKILIHSHTRRILDILKLKLKYIQK